MDQLALFDPGPGAVRRLSAEARRRMYFEWVLAQGYHPSTGLKTDDEHACRDCVHRVSSGGHSRCLMGVFAAGKPTEVLARWPACGWWRMKSGAIQPEKQPKRGGTRAVQTVRTVVL